MASFPSPGLPRELLEQIATKCEGKAYLRLQQTCRLMNELVQTRRNIRVFLKRGCKLKRAVLDNGTSQVQLFKNDNIQMDPKSLYGIRIHSIELPMEMTDEEIEELCDTLKQSRFTATLIYLQSINFYKKSMLTKEQCTRLFETLKPTRFSIDSKESNRFEAILSSNIQDMEDVSLQVDAVIASSAAIRLLPRFQNVTIHVGFLSFREEEEIFDCFMAILQFLRWTSLPKLKYFTFSARRASRTPNVQETFQKFSEFNPILRLEARSGLYPSDIKKQVSIRLALKLFPGILITRPHMKSALRSAMSGSRFQFDVPHKEVIGQDLKRWSDKLRGDGLPGYGMVEDLQRKLAAAGVSERLFLAKNEDLVKQIGTIEEANKELADDKERRNVVYDVAIKKMQELERSNATKEEELKIEGIRQRAMVDRLRGVEEKNEKLWKSWLAHEKNNTALMIESRQQEEEIERLTQLLKDKEILLLKKADECDRLQDQYEKAKQSSDKMICLE